MEISIVGQKGLKIKAKNTSFIVNPEKKFDEEIVLLTDAPADYSQFPEKIVFAGPGEYEAAGVSIKAGTGEKGVYFDFFEEGQRLVVLPTPGSSAKFDTEDASCIVTYADGSNAEDIVKLTGDVVAVIAPQEFLPKESSSIKKTEKINLKKTDDFKGVLVHLSK
jgi:hypothetical protein